MMVQMKLDYKSNKNFTFYDPVHLGLKSDNKYYIIDGQHRLIAYYNLFLKNKYPIQKIPCVVWTVKSDDEFLLLFDRINMRTPIDSTKLFNYKIQKIIGGLDVYFSNGKIWGKNRPTINKDLFVQKMRENDNIHCLESDTVIKQIIEINDGLRKMPRIKRSIDRVSANIHVQSELMDFFLGYDKKLLWISQII